VAAATLDSGGCYHGRLRLLHRSVTGATSGGDLLQATTDIATRSDKFCDKWGATVLQGVRRGRRRSYVRAAAMLLAWGDSTACERRSRGGAIGAGGGAACEGGGAAGAGTALLTARATVLQAGCDNTGGVSSLSRHLRLQPRAWKWRRGISSMIFFPAQEL
jgi:hypothetical protein